ncbi:MAG: exo-alpha-sialidase [Bacteroidetes bacterium]|nr:exo-alpha-sialidase [Bacteroidota bacterium]
MKRTPEQLSKWSAPPSFGNTVAFVCAILGLLALTSSCDGFLTNDQADREFPPDPISWELAFVDSLYPVSFSHNGDLLNIHDGLIFKSSDQGRSWTIIQPQIPDGWNNLVGPIVVLPSGDILAELGGQHPFPFHDPYAALARSVNGGDSFEVIATDFLGSDNVWQDLVNFDIGLLSDLYLAVYNPRVGSDLTIYRSTDEGDSWVDTGLQVRYRIPTVHIAEEIGTYWTTVEKTVYHSSNWGISWQSVTDHPWEDVVDLGVSGNGRVFVVGYNGTGSSSDDYILSLYFSNDKGATWSRVDGFSFELGHFSWTQFRINLL